MLNATTPAWSEGEDVPKNYRIGRCSSCATAYAWRGAAARPGCIACGGALDQTTRRLRARFFELEGDLLRSAELLPSGLESSARWEDRRADDLERHQARLVADVAAGRATLREDGWFQMGNGSAYGPLGDVIARHRAKAAKHRARARKLEQ